MKYLPVLLLFLCFLQACDFSTKKPAIQAAFQSVEKAAKNDPFKKTMAESQFFDIDAKEGGIAESRNGIIMAIPENAFVDEDGNPVEGTVKIEFAEAINVDDMILSGLESVTDKNEILESAGMFFFDAFANGKKVFINPENPPYIELPANGSTEGFMLYDGKRDEQGKLRWEKPKPLENWLIAVDLELLDFYPEGFETAVEEGMPFRHYQTADKDLKDSLYYSLKSNGDYGISSDTGCYACGISPASVKVIRQEKFSNTLVSTREFVKRLQSVYKTCQQEVLNVYINNLDKNLWECDSMAADLLKGKPVHEKLFRSYAAEKLTKVKTNKNLKKLSGYYQKQLKKTEVLLEKTRAKYQEQLKKEDEAAVKTRQEYAEILTKRQAYRMKKFGFFLTENGWKNIDKPGPARKEIKPMTLEITVKDGKAYDRVHVYIVNEVIKSLFAMQSSDSVLFDRGYPRDNILLLWDKQPAVAIAVAYKDEIPSYGLVDFTAQEVVRLEINLLPTTEKDLKKALKSLGRYYRNENKILTDLEYQKKFYMEKLRQERLEREREFILSLEMKAFPCDCGGLEQFVKGKRLFEENCKQCHDLFKTVVGPSLRGITKRRTIPWTIAFIKNSQQIIRSGDPVAVEMFDIYSGTVMPPYLHLSEADIREIIDYVDCSKSYTVMEVDTLLE